VKIEVGQTWKVVDHAEGGLFLLLEKVPEGWRALCLDVGEITIVRTVGNRDWVLIEMNLQDASRASGQVWILKAWPNRFFCLLYRDDLRNDPDVEVWAVMDLETGELHDANFMVTAPTKNVRVA